MQKILAVGAVAVLMIASFLFGKSALSHAGRYQIYIDPAYRADKYLLDTETGRTWQITQESTEKYMFWHEMPKDSLPSRSGN